MQNNYLLFEHLLPYDFRWIRKSIIIRSKVSLRKSVLLLLIIVLCILPFSACNKNKPGSETGFIYPSKTDFVFEVEIEKRTISLNDTFKINCKLMNKSGNKYDIEHGEEVISYVYDGKGEFHNSIAIISTFEVDEVKNRSLKIETTKVGKGIITIKATIYVKPNKHSDQHEEYSYSKDIEVEVIL